jgi:nicotinamide phosphoribosyltransferase
VVAVVSDSYDVFRACDELWGGELLEAVNARGERGGMLVIRPDSGDPKEVVVKVSYSTRVLGNDV